MKHCGAVKHSSTMKHSNAVEHSNTVEHSKIAVVAKSQVQGIHSAGILCLGIRSVGNPLGLVACVVPPVEGIPGTGEFTVTGSPQCKGILCLGILGMRIIDLGILA